MLNGNVIAKERKIKCLQYSNDPMQKGSPKKKINPQEKQKKPGLEYKMTQAPQFDSEITNPGKKLISKVALITGGDSGIGRAIAVTFAKHGAVIAICYLEEERKDAELTKQYVESYGGECLLLPGNIANERHCETVIKKVIKHYDRLDILINNAAIHYPQ